MPSRCVTAEEITQLGDNIIFQANNSSQNSFEIRGLIAKLSEQRLLQQQFNIKTLQGRKAMIKHKVLGGYIQKDVQILGSKQHVIFY